MDYAITGTIFTLVVFIVFIGIVIWAYSKKSKKGFDEAANLIFADEDKDKKEKRESGTHE
ncbi:MULTISPECIES: cbb3-type cytochrome c oxidase subunit 3 [unclassified Paraglaciecola]|uniref:cbb3-type cytochrome oxidase subunit 3 n=1 Tax=unclassified Paraglaciecola TaxID=2685791 RepID=UPI00131E8BE5|nr:MULTISPECIES: cbb3-type cytochrome c oxidase subunit 3 [unclassified Paraglaciecola]|tara:strand:+ start:3551 stop:3730 length:180 start_codon:yes stop_codon:yes gene_type:complete